LRRVKRDAGTSPSHLNFLTIGAREGVSGIKKALKDPKQLLPVLAALGIGLETLAPRQSESPDGL